MSRMREIVLATLQVGSQIGGAQQPGVFVHPSHKWFLSSAHAEDDVDHTLEAMDHAFARVAPELGKV